MAPRDDETTKTYIRKAMGVDWKSIVAWAAGFVATTALTVAGWAHGVLWGHDTRLTTLEVHRMAASQEYGQHQERDAKVQEQIQAILRRLEDKVDRLSERRLP